MKKKLERKLLAAGIEIDKHYNESTQETYNVIRNCSRCLILDQYPAPTFKECKKFLKFEGNDWDGLTNRLEKNSYWFIGGDKDTSIYRNVYYNHGDSPLLDVTDLSIRYRLTRHWIEYKPHQIWKFLDKIDAAKGGKQTVKFKGNEYEFNFPSVETKPLVKVTKKGIELSGRFEGDVVVEDVIFNQDDLIVEECNEHKEEQLKELKPRKRVVAEQKFNTGHIDAVFPVIKIPTTLDGKRESIAEAKKTLYTMNEDQRESEEGVALSNKIKLLIKAYNEQEPNEPAWKSVTGWDSIKDNGNKCRMLFGGQDYKIPDLEIKNNPRIGYFATEKQAKQILALSQLTQIHKAMMEGEKLVNFNDTGERGFFYSILFSRKCRHNISSTTTDLGFKVNCTPFEIDFYTEKQRYHFIKHNEDLINQYIGL